MPKSAGERWQFQPRWLQLIWLSTSRCSHITEEQALGDLQGAIFPTDYIFTRPNNVDRFLEKAKVT